MKSPREMFHRYAEDSKIAKVMREDRAGKLHSGSKTGPLVEHGSKQEKAIALNEARKAGEDVAPKKYGHPHELAKSLYACKAR